MPYTKTTKISDGPAVIATSQLAQIMTLVDEVDASVEIFSLLLLPGDVFKARKALTQMREASYQLQQILQIVS